MTDTSNVTWTFDKQSYNTGETITATLSGTVTAGDVSTTDAVSGSIVDDTGATVPLAVADLTIVTPGAPVGFKFGSVTDTAGRVWTVSADGKTATAIA